jgi:hypothetical protein
VANTGKDKAAFVHKHHAMNASSSGRFTPDSHWIGGRSASWSEEKNPCHYRESNDGSTAHSQSLYWVSILYDGMKLSHGLKIVKLLCGEENP